MTNIQNIRKPFGDWARSVQSRLNYEYEASKSVLTHGSVLGAIREGVIRDILSRFLPRSVEIGTGQVVDIMGELSGQVDIIVARDTTPVFRFEGNMSAFLAETVLATIEVKSMLYREKLHESLENSKSVKELTYIMHVSAKGSNLFQETFKWVAHSGGLEQIEERMVEPSLVSTLGCPDDIWSILHFVRYWLHWEKGHFRDPQYFKKLGEILENTDFDFFVDLLQYVTKQQESFNLLTSGFNKHKNIKKEFFDRLYEYVLYEHLPPSTIVLAYGGYENLRNMVEEVKSWYDNNRSNLHWYQLPKVIMNHKMVMYRHYNKYHCNEFDYPALFMMNAICDVLAKDLSFSTSIGATSIVKYFDISRILGKEHPKYAPSYLIWSIPIDNSTAGEITSPNSR